MTSIKIVDQDPRPHYLPAGGPFDRIQTMSVDNYLLKVRPYFRPAGHPNVRPVVASLRNEPGWMLCPCPEVGIKPLEPDEAPRMLNTLRSLLEFRPPFPE